jgi:hypothetical protein
MVKSKAFAASGQMSCHAARAYKGCRQIYCIFYCSKSTIGLLMTKSKVKYFKKKWVVNSYEAWARDLAVVSPTTVKRSIKKLKTLGAITVEKLSRFQGNRTNWITINYDKLLEIVPPLLEQPTAEKKKIRPNDLIIGPK